MLRYWPWISPVSLQNVTKGARHKIALSIQKLRERQSVLKSLEKVIQTERRRRCPFSLPYKKQHFVLKAWAQTNSILVWRQLDRYQLSVVLQWMFNLACWQRNRATAGLSRCSVFYYMFSPSSIFFSPSNLAESWNDDVKSQLHITMN